MRDDITIAEVMQLHDERLTRSNVDVRRLREELEAEIIRQDQIRDARLHFMRYVAPTTGEPTP